MIYLISKIFSKKYNLHINMSYEDDISDIYLDNKPVFSGLDQSHLEEPWENYGGDNNIGFSDMKKFLYNEVCEARSVKLSLATRLNLIQYNQKKQFRDMF